MQFASIDTAFDKYQKDIKTQSRRSWLKRMGYTVDRWVKKNSLEALDDPKTPVETRIKIIEHLSQASHRFGLFKRVFRHLLPLLEAVHAQHPARPVTLLDMGAGGGGLLRVIHKSCQKTGIPIELAGIDLQQEVAASTEERLKSEGIPVRMRQGDVCNLTTFDDNSIDIVVSLFVVHHIQQPSQITGFIQEIHRVMRHSALVCDIDRSFYGLCVMLVGGLLSGADRLLLFDGMRSVRRAYKAREITFIADKAQQFLSLKGLTVTSPPLLSTWFLYFDK